MTTEFHVQHTRGTYDMGHDYAKYTSSITPNGETL